MQEGKGEKSRGKQVGGGGGGGRGITTKIGN